MRQRRRAVRPPAMRRCSATRPGRPGRRSRAGRAAPSAGRRSSPPGCRRAPPAASSSACQAHSCDAEEGQRRSSRRPAAGAAPARGAAVRAALAARCSSHAAGHQQRRAQPQLPRHARSATSRRAVHAHHVGGEEQREQRAGHADEHPQADARRRAAGRVAQRSPGAQRGACSCGAPPRWPRPARRRLAARRRRPASGAFCAMKSSAAPGTL